MIPLLIARATSAAGRQFLHLAAAAAILLVISAIEIALSGQGAFSQPSRAIKVIVPFPAGGTADLIARVLGEQIGRTRGVTIVIDDRPGAGSAIGTEVAARATPDGNTLLMFTSGAIINALLRKLNYDPLTSFEPICNLVQSPHLLVVNSALPYRTVADLISAARASPDALTFASTGPASNSQIAFEILKRAAKVEMTYVPFPGNAPTVNAILGAHVTSAVANYVDLVEHVKAGKLRALATFMPTRIESLSALPTIAESGYKASEYWNWFGVVAPAGTQKEPVSQLSAWFSAALQAPEVRAKLAVQGLYPMDTCGADFASYLHKQSDDYGRVIRAANIKAE